MKRKNLKKQIMIIVIIGIGLSISIPLIINFMNKNSIPLIPVSFSDNDLATNFGWSKSAVSEPCPAFFMHQSAGNALIIQKETPMTTPFDMRYNISHTTALTIEFYVTYANGGFSGSERQLLRLYGNGIIVMEYDFEWYKGPGVIGSVPVGTSATWKFVYNGTHFAAILVDHPYYMISSYGNRTWTTHLSGIQVDQVGIYLVNLFAQYTFRNLAGSYVA